VRASVACPSRRVEVFLDDLLSPRQLVAPALKEIMADQMSVSHLDSSQLHLRQAPPIRTTAIEDWQKLCRCRVRVRGLYLALGLKPILQIVPIRPSALLVKFVGAFLNLLLNRDQDGRFRPTSVGVLMAFSRSPLDGDLLFPQLFSLPFQFVGFGTFACHTYSLAC